MYKAGAVEAGDITKQGFELGWNFQSNADAVALVNDITSIGISPTNEPLLELTLANTEASYKSFYWPHRVGSDYWFNMGQPLDTLVPSVAASGYRTVLSLRNDGEATARLSTDPSTGFVNNNEFSDANGNYNVTAERLAFEGVNATFVNLPVTGSSAYDVDLFFSSFVPVMDNAQKRGATLAHCASGYRSAAYVSTYLAHSQGQCSSWALRQAALVGFAFDVNEADKVVVNFMKAVLKC